ncbi:hypothetical protein EYR41_001439 [Orbilia oligospora]|uniref:Uncharacterized protein n=1 Tax=Orbilia oligospora TaxID=2813651 RepID=A0A8H2HZQ9_ORBOL|nr:hypothetical protein EYR41_001439 [Orbilia oligospora]
MTQEQLQESLEAMSLKEATELTNQKIQKMQDDLQKFFLLEVQKIKARFEDYMEEELDDIEEQHRENVKKIEGLWRTYAGESVRSLAKSHDDLTDKVTASLRCFQSRELMLGIRYLVLTARQMYQNESFCQNCGKGIPLTSVNYAVSEDDPIEKATPEDIKEISHGILNAKDLKLLKFSELNGDETDIRAYDNWAYLALLLSNPSYVDVKEKYSNMFKWVVGNSIENVAEKAYRLHIVPYWH